MLANTATAYLSDNGSANSSNFMHRQNISGGGGENFRFHRCKESLHLAKEFGEIASKIRIRTSEKNTTRSERGLH